jgi:hypothetical protein
MVRMGDHTPVLATTRLLAAVIVPFLLAAWGILYLLPHRTGELFAWPIQPSMTAMVLGAVYLGGAHFFVQVIVSPSWERIALGFLPVAAFAGLLGVATVLHWDRFTSGHVSFAAWAGLYFLAPFLVVAAWLANGRVRQPAGTDHPHPLQLSRQAQLVTAAVGAGAVVLGLVLFVWPETLLEVWPWSLTPLTARVMAAVCVLGGAGIGVLQDARWVALRLLVQVLWVMLGLILLATVRAWDQLRPRAGAAWAFVAWMLAVLVGSVVLYLTMERRSRQPTPDRITSRRPALPDRGSPR